jgi:hypothetical protein
MSEYTAGTNDVERRLERELALLTGRVAFPATPDMATAVRARLAAEPRTAPIVDLAGGRVRRRPWLYAAAAILVLALIASLTLSSVREAVADWLGVPGIRIEFGDDADQDAETPLPSASPEPSPSPQPDLDLGEEVSLATASTHVVFDIAAPDAQLVGEPDAVYVRLLPDGERMVSLVYFADERLPRAAETGVGLLIMQFRAAEEVQYMIKSIMGPEDPILTTVDGGRGYWAEGASSLMILGDPSRTCCPGSARPSANVLIWQKDGITYRLETALSFAEAKAIAESMI